MPDPVTTQVLLGAATAALKRIWKDSKEQREFLQGVVPKASSDVRGAVVDWLQDPSTVRLLISEDPRMHALAADGLRGHYRASVKSPETAPDAAIVVPAARGQLLDQLPVRELLKRHTRDLRAQMQEITDRQTEHLTTALRDKAPTRGQLPPDVEAHLQRLEEDEPEVARWLADWLASHPTSGGVRQQLAPESRLNRSDREAAWAAVATYAATHRMPVLAAELWQRCAEVSARPSLALAQRARHLQAVDADEARRIADQAVELEDAPPPLALAVRGSLEGDDHAVAQLVDELHLVGPDDDLVVAYVAEALVRTGQVTAAVRLAEEAAETLGTPLAQALLAGVLLFQVFAGGVRDRSETVNRARTLALQAREANHALGLPAIDATRIAAQALAESADFDGVLQLEDEARAGGFMDELNDPDTAGIVALAHVATGLEDPSGVAVPEFTQALLATLQPHLEGSEPRGSEEYTESLYSLRDLAQDDEDLVRVLLALARVDAVSDQDVADLSKRDAAAAQLVRAVQLHTRGDSIGAAHLVRQHARDAAQAAWFLANLQHEAGEFEGAAETVLAAWRHQQDVVLLGYGLQAAVLASEAAGQVTDASQGLKDIGVQVVGEAYLTDTQRRRLLHRLAELESLAGKWAASAAWLRQLLAIEPVDPGFHWWLAQMYVNDGQLDSAWDAVREDAGELRPPRTPAALGLCLGLTMTFSSDPDHVRQLLEIANDFEGDHRGRTLVAAIGLSTRLPESPEGPAAFAALNKFIDEHPDTRVIRRVTADDLTAPGLDEFAPAVPVELSLTELDALNGRLPLALVPLLANVTVTAYLARDPYRVLRSATASVVHRQEERRTAAAALGGTVVVDVPALFNVARIELSDEAADTDALFALFHQVQLPAEAALDIAMAAAPQPTAAGHLVAPPFPGEPHCYVEADEEQQQRARDLTQAMAARSKRLSRISTPDERVLTPTDARDHAAFAAAEIGVSTGTPVWTDDAALRAILRRMGVPTFGTRALLDVAASAGLLDDESRRRLLRAERSTRTTSLPFPVPEMLELAAANSVTAAATIMAEPGWWASRHNLVQHRVTQFFDEAVQRNPDDVPLLLGAAAVGLLMHSGNLLTPARVLLALLATYPDLHGLARELHSATEQGCIHVTRSTPTPLLLEKALGELLRDHSTDDLRELRAVAKLYPALATMFPGEQAS
jgi:tetratricopeptide (TPR) repeat protein